MPSGHRRSIRLGDGDYLIVGSVLDPEADTKGTPPLSSSLYGATITVRNVEKRYMCLMRGMIKTGVLVMFLLGVTSSSASYAEELVTLSVRLKASSVTELALSLPKVCVRALDGMAPVYDVVDVDVGCVLHDGPPMTSGLRQIVFQVHGRSPSASAPDSDEPHRLTDEDRKVLESLGPLAPEPTAANFPVAGQVTSRHPMSDTAQKMKDGDGREYYLTADTVWLNSYKLRSQAMRCVSVWKSGAGNAKFAPTESRCNVWLNYHDIELVAVLDLTSAISLNTFEQLLAAFEKTTIVH
jgi:hypothetical protein